MSELDIVAVHEAGHAVASMLWDGPTVSRSALVAGNSHHAGLTEYDSDDFELRAEVITAGPVAEAMHTAGHRPTTSDLFRAFDGYGHLDYATLTASGRPIPTDVVALTLERVCPPCSTSPTSFRYAAKSVQAQCSPPSAFHVGGSVTPTSQDSARVCTRCGGEAVK
ncbi:MULTISPECIES: hypothetical protein [unclassified Gordonia (in: high G+C Gram-positive bacteria)]|uniref:hypothetical protein n=1 Tax=unclassified Gordonia (in: high G+C Gram-positive bacteria) TaxID=2657482 RepID=UPI00071C9305|nr:MULTISPECIES: hypothetical protein [unclassified Gordonia (in: high G+C Gram-positive bacteria)]KSU60858.1 hypothetical protein AS181_03795 [Gordonia sp. SGD-V-85]SCB89035.1 hypothetical protein GA0061091_102352 [Gordonia sp. v-85]